MNIGDCTGLERPRVLIHPTKPIRRFITDATPLEQQQAARFYVAVTRAKHSVGIIVNRFEGSRLPFWTPKSTRLADT
jgi:DNA helicase-2/ATP-dependent DNA helicase PcrA